MYDFYVEENFANSELSNNLSRYIKISGPCKDIRIWIQTRHPISIYILQLTKYISLITVAEHIYL